MKPIDEIINKIGTTSQQEFKFTDAQHLDEFSLSEDQLEAIMTASSVMFVYVLQLPQVINEEGKRAAAKAFRMYRQAVKSFAEQTHAHFDIYDPCSFLLIYPGPREEARKVVKLAMQLSGILTKCLNEFPNQFSLTDFTIGIDHGRVLGTNEGRIIWQGICIEKAKRISEMCSKPYRIGITGLVNSILEESDKVVEKHILGIPKKEEIWIRNSYDFFGEHKHYYVTRHTEEYQPQDQN